MPSAWMLDDLGEHLSVARLNSAPASMAPLTRCFCGIGLGLERAARLFQADAGDVEPVLDVIEQPARQRLDQRLLRRQRVGGSVVRLDPVPVVEDPPLPVDLTLGALPSYRLRSS